MNDRQRDIYTSHLRGESLNHIATQYGISYSRAYQLFQKAKKEEERRKLIQENKSILNPVLEALPLSARTRNCLSSIGIQDLSQLLEKTEEDLLAIRNCGAQTIAEIQSFLKDHGLHLSK